jgi:hypothetical protein
MKLGQRIHVEFYGELVREGKTWIHVQDAFGNVHELHEDKVWEVVPPEHWPPVPGDVWKHLDVSFLAETRQGRVWLIPSNDEGSISPDEVLRMRPGIRLVSRISDAAAN